MLRLAPRTCVLALGIGSILAGCTEPDATKAPAGPPAPLADVELVVDELGITHVYARSDADAFFGAGYAMARDRLFHMELMRRRAAGTRAELVGVKVLDDDVMARTMNFTKLGEADEARVRAERPEEAALFDAWTAGVNLRIEEVRSGAAPRPFGMRESELDFLPEPWASHEAFAVGKLLSFGMSNSLDRDILATAVARMAPETAERLPVLMPAFDVFPGAPAGAGGNAAPAPGPFGPPGPPKADAAAFPRDYEPIMRETASNNWALAGKHTESGRPYVCGDPHQSLTSPSRFWAVHMNSAEAGGTLDVVGFSFVGTPTVQLGHNAHIGWTATTNFADVMDLWDVAPDAAYESVSVGGETVPLVKRDEVFRVIAPGAKAGTFVDEVTVEIAEVPGYGVILPDEMLPIPRPLLADGRLLFNWTGFAPSMEAVAYLEIDRAKDIDAFEEAASILEVGAANFVAADAKEIDMFVHARVPDRGDPSARPMPWRSITDPEDPASYWTRGDLPADRMPKRRDPPEGFLFTANTDPFGFTQDGVVENDPYYYGAFYANGFRGYRIEQAIEELVASGAKVDRAAMEELQRDVRSPLADTIVPLLEEALANVEADPALAAYKGRADLVAYAAKLSAWDREMRADRGEPVMFNALVWFAARRVFEKPMTSALFGAIHEASPPFFLGMLHNVLTNRFADASYFAPDGARVLLLAALDEASAWITTRFGSIDADFELGDVQGALFQSDLPGSAWDTEPMAVGGASDTINVAPTRFFDGNEPAAYFESTEMSLYRMVVGFAADGTPEATVNFGRGNSAEPDSPHYDDQDAAWTSVTYAPLPFRRADVEAREESRVILAGGGK
ncbi:penicillin acylase family protein [Polyangium spumosum]|uniref:Uncharacterized protein n=1 Tax=Polyangium spumosum TaxID=889282 RepID=A0A6N7PVB2_9BACT|nr:penicillin acylase family protein [Polyangium spumosum]MRG95849.1 hypothetical protein [Polyangium spumosum]